MSYSPFEFYLLSWEGEGGGFYGIESRANIRKLDIYEGTEEGFTGVSEAGWHNLWGYRWTQEILKSYRKRVIIDFRNKNVVIARFRDKN